MKLATFHSEASAELLDAMDWYDERQYGLGAELMTEVQRAVNKIEHDPGIGARFRNTKFRFYRVDRFPYLVYYQEFLDRVWIVTIAHERRRPGYWKRRKPE